MADRPRWLRAKQPVIPPPDQPVPPRLLTPREHATAMLITLAKIPVADVAAEINQPHATAIVEGDPTSAIRYLQGRVAADRRAPSPTGHAWEALKMVRRTIREMST